MLPTIDVYLSEMCGSYYQLRENINAALAELGITARVEYHTIYYEDAVRLDIKGSPSIWINGSDAFDGPPSPGIT